MFLILFIQVLAPLYLCRPLWTSLCKVTCYKVDLIFFKVQFRPEGVYQYFIKIKVKGPFNNYVDKMREEGGQKMSVILHTQGRKTDQTRGRGQKMTKVQVVVE